MRAFLTWQPGGWDKTVWLALVAAAVFIIEELFGPLPTVPGEWMPFITVIVILLRALIDRYA